MDKEKVVLMILDGLGVSERVQGNAVKAANMPNYDAILQRYPNELGNASGLDVGLPLGQMGNSEVGHLNIGAGRVVYQDFTRINKSIEDRSFFENESFLKAMQKCKAEKTSLHLIGLLSDGGVHSHIEHLFALLELAKEKEVSDLYVHAFLDGRDTAPNSGEKYIVALEEKMRSIGIGKIATIVGRYYAMDRDNRWDRVEKAYNAMVNSDGRIFKSAEQCIQASYENEIYDEFVEPSIILMEGDLAIRIEDNDSIICFNFRPDRAREITKAFVLKNFVSFDRKIEIKNLEYTCFTQYDETIENVNIAFFADNMKNTIGEYLSKLSKKQLRLAETEKYAHVTFFFSGGIEAPFEGEDRILVPSPKVATYDLLPEMSAEKVSDELIKAIQKKDYDLIVVNFANPDMVGHTGVFEAAVRALEFIDFCIGRIIPVILDTNTSMFICADHGNVEQMLAYENKMPYTAHTTNPVNFILLNFDEKYKLKQGGVLSDIAATVLEMLGLPAAPEMTGKSLLELCSEDPE